MRSRTITIERVVWILWMVLLISIPITSSPFVASFSGGETPVSPLALFPLVAIVVLYLLPELILGKKLPQLFWPLVGFVLISLISAIASVRLQIYPFKGIDQGARLIRALLTLGIGISFYTIAAWLPADKQRLVHSIRALYLGLVLMLIWSSVQAVIVLDGSDRMPLVVTRIHHLFSVRDPLPNRVTGMAFEPSWLGDQLVVLYLPFLLSSVVHGWSVFPRTNRWVTFEFFLLIWAVFILFLTQSRISFLTVLLLMVAGYFVFGYKIIKRVAWSSERPLERPGYQSLLISLLVIVLLLSLLIGGIIGLGRVLSDLDPRLDNLFSVHRRVSEFAYFHPNEAIFEAAGELAFAERLTYWAVGFRTFAANPILGVGPGNTGFFFEENLPAYSQELVEIQNVIRDQDFGFPNPKNLWIRLLSESGILGFSFYWVWYVLLTSLSVWLTQSLKSYGSVFGLAGLLILGAQAIEGFSIDTYALPHFWIAVGILTASGSQCGHFKQKAPVRASLAEGGQRAGSSKCKRIAPHEKGQPG
jgi:O-antigen ligase